MSARLNPFVAYPALVQPLVDFGLTVHGYGLEKTLMDLVKVRASQINRCALCLDLHARTARAAGETEERILMLSSWRETTLYTAREQAALAWTECLTRDADEGAPDGTYEDVRKNFSDEEQVALTLLIGVINSFNRIGAGYRLPPIPAQHKAA